MVFVCDMITINPAMGARWGEYRRAVLSRFVRYHVRVATAAANFIDAASFETTAPPNYAADVSSAIEAIRLMRGSKERHAG